MINKVKYSDEEIEFGETMKDFFPLPSQLIPKQKTVEIKINLTDDQLPSIERETNEKRIF